MSKNQKYMTVRGHVVVSEPQQVKEFLSRMNDITGLLQLKRVDRAVKALGLDPNNIAYPIQAETLDWYNRAITLENRYGGGYEGKYRQMIKRVVNKINQAYNALEASALEQKVI